MKKITLREATNEQIITALKDGFEHNKHGYIVGVK